MKPRRKGVWLLMHQGEELHLERALLEMQLQVREREIERQFVNEREGERVLFS